MSFISLLGIAGIIIGLFQILTPDFFLKIRLQGIKTREAVKNGGYVAIIVGILFIIFDIFSS
jgi:hypothetical protein